jgi:hypothetical protein
MERCQICPISGECIHQPARIRRRVQLGRMWVDEHFDVGGAASGVGRGASGAGRSVGNAGRSAGSAVGNVGRSVGGAVGGVFSGITGIFSGLFANLQMFAIIAAVVIIGLFIL